MKRRMGAVAGLMIILLISVVVAKENVWAAPYISDKTVIMKTGQSHILNMKNAKKVKWSSSDKKVAAVSKKGKVKAKKAGRAIITAKVGKKKFKASITVSDAGSMMEKKSMVMTIGSTDVPVTWDYTRLGKIDLSKSELTELLGNGDVTITLNMR